MLAPAAGGAERAVVREARARADLGAAVRALEAPPFRRDGPEIIPEHSTEPKVVLRSRIYRWYSKLRAFDPERHKEEGTERLQEYLVKLKGVEEKVSNIAVPLSFSEELYHLRMHIDMLRSKLKQMIENQEKPDDSCQRVTPDKQ